ncbi:uncharacterized protein LOC141710961 [Apium graveolens]|uniref:uncharacterized protein LOC141710961 n=1 Tax=Apium graveolens TaxID=4045 RepID=UPI003D7AB0C6
MASESPLSVKIENAKINRDLKVPPINSFDGSTDPSDFINLFDGRMDFFGHSEMARCRFFSTCLKGTALNWFNNLPPQSIDSWTNLKSKFRNRFSSNKKGGKIIASLIIVYQRTNESLRAYLTRFRAHIAEITDLTSPLEINYLIAEIDRTRHSQLLEELLEKEPKTLQSTIKIIEHRLTLQEVVGSIQYSRSPRPRYERSPRRSREYDKRSYKSQQETENPRGPRGSQTSLVARSYQRPHERRSENSGGREAKKLTTRDKDYPEPIKLNTDMATILAVLKTYPTYRPPRPMNPNRPPSNKYCEFHEDTGHNTEQCFQLTNLIEDKVRSGQLAHYAETTQSRRHQHHDPDRVINVISGGYSAGGSSNNSKKLYMRDVYRIETKRPRKNPTPIISFSDEDYIDDIIEDHQDALVITTKVSTNTVKKIIVDNGSSVDILYYSAYSRMNLGDRKLNTAKGTPLYGFIGNEVKLVGVIDLPVLFGSTPCQI